MQHIDLLLSVLAIVGYFITFTKYAADRKADAERRAKESQKIEDALENLTVRVDSHNHYAEMFAETKSEISEVKENVAFIRGKIE